jgi:hypothetical protein
MMEEQTQNQLDVANEEVIETKVSLARTLLPPPPPPPSDPFPSSVSLHGHSNPQSEQWKETAPPIIQDLYSSMIHKERDIQAFHIWLRLLDDNLVPNIRGLTVHYHNVPSKNDDYDLIRMSFLANPDKASNRKTKIQVFAFSLSSPSSSPSSSSSSTDINNESTPKGEPIPWDSFLEDVKNQHQIMHAKGELDGDYDCFVVYKQYARLYTLRGAERANIRECWVTFGAEKMQSLGIQTLWTDRDDFGPLFEFKTHYTMIMHLLRAFAWNINIPYVFKSRKYSRV